MQAFCLRCRVNSDIIECREVKLKNGRTALHGKCSICGSSLFRIGKIKQIISAEK
ncbi:MAG: DUF5679 domain-containing protein [Dehalococcoidia bacterium]